MKIVKLRANPEFFFVAYISLFCSVFVLGENEIWEVRVFGKVCEACESSGKGGEGGELADLGEIWRLFGKVGQNPNKSRLAFMSLWCGGLQFCFCPGAPRTL